MVKPMVINPDTITEVGKGCLILYTTKDSKVNVKAGRVLMTYDIVNTVQDDAKSGKSYMVNVSRIPVSIVDMIYDLNLQAMRHKVEKVVPTNTAHINEEILEM